LTNAQLDVASANAVISGNVGFVTTPTIANTLANRADTIASTTPVWAGSLHDGQCIGVRALSTNGMPASTMTKLDASVDAPTLCVVLRPLWSDWRRREIGELVTLPYHVARDSEFAGKVRIKRAGSTTTTTWSRAGKVRQLIAMNNAIISPTANPMSVPAATPRQSIFCSLAVISTSPK
jgi:hypothetical protein